MELLTAALPVSATVLVAIVGYLQWRRSERRQAESETVRHELEQAERRRIARGPYDQKRLEALQELLDKLRDLEIQSRWNAGGRDLRAEVPKIKRGSRSLPRTASTSADTRVHGIGRSL
ncbi:hypothetical protein AB0N17_41805 [Streptomyces sp. NPDC051133]|uniref:hypothetical protein n=1 Tax=Streptomyces sp. NPDC051133 TaxID=3155521 RepID=UPI00341BBB59